MAWFSKFLALATCIWPALALAQASPAVPSAVVLMYHRFGEGRFPSTNIGLDQLKAHIAYLQAERFNVVPLAEVVAALDRRAPLPPRTVAITVDDAYASVVAHAWPLFKRAGFPFTVFVATAAVDQGQAGIMSWAQVRALAADGVTIGGHSHAHPHYPALSAEAVRADLAAMNARFMAELGAVPTVFAYPYGEAGRADMALVRDAGFAAAFGQNSGPVYPEAERFLLPRFALNEAYGAMDRFALVVHSRPLRAVDLVPADPVLRANPPALSFRVLDAPPLAGLSCFGPRGERLAVSVAAATVRVAPAAPFPTGRARVNCTLKAGAAWYWFGQEFLAGGASEGVPVHARYRN
jgi:peptidoglycan/xylan/chitin deacetylase (PgdA/CDA1 family)